MGCCGKHSGKIQTVKNIVSGHVNRLFDQVFMVRGELYNSAQKRQAVCQTCEYQTWLKKAKYLDWLKANGIEVFKNLDDLTALPPLEKQPFEPGKSMFCQLCKCWIPAKAYAKDAKCPKNKW